ncbi:protein POLYCHOME [Rhodamnia argentea]|uniref:Protein POLYCHOME n=1 Tax=Rhodamnia argentea TaxID=178133 RepID=A0ABM3HZS8_9MYRT|nr:protein POLYCHOME [Rhodamnia argentea]
MPPESRDRLVRVVDVAAVYARRRAGILGALENEPELGSNLFEPMVARRTAGVVGARAPVGLGRGGAVGRAVLGTPRNVIGRGRNLFASPLVGRESTPLPGSTRRGRGRQDSVLPPWYPRTPLRDVTSVVRAYERRRARLLETEGRQADSPATTELSIGESSVPRVRAPLEHDISLHTPGPAVAEKPRPLSVGKVPKILLDITNQTRAADSEFLTPQKKLLNEIDTVEKVVMDELRRLKRTPAAKKAERQKRVRTLMSMR